MPQNLPATRTLINRLRLIMAAEGHVRPRLDQVVRLIASVMVADVCSIYARIADGTLLLVATEGLKPEAVYRTRLLANEGLVGLVARRAEPMAIQDAPRHTAFSYRPETGEDPFHAFLGVPIVRGGRVTGVLTLQNRTERLYTDEEIDTLQTVSMVLAELVDQIKSELPGQTGANGHGRKGRSAQVLKGRVFCEGIGFGRVVLHDPVVPGTQMFALDSERELTRMRAAIDTLRGSIDRIAAIDSAALGEDPRDVMETYRMLAHDEMWAAKLREGVQSGLTAEAAVDRVRSEHRARLLSARDPYLRERLDDLENLDNRLLRILAGAEDGRPSLVKGAVLVARRLGPAELLDYAEAGLAGILIEEAAASSHAAIVARAMGIPAIGGIPELTLRVEDGDHVIVDAERGEIHVGGDGTLATAFETRRALRSERQATFAALRALPNETRDGVPFRLMINAGLEMDLDMLDAAGADGVGLFRTEFQFLVSDRLPSLKDQSEFYSRVIARAAGRPVVFRTLDLGGDKVLPALSQRREENPALGWRSIRFALDYPGLFRRQLRALITAVDGGPLRLMFPMVTVPSEFFDARDLLMKEIDRAVSRGHRAPQPLEIGVMLETPALAYSLKELSGAASFLSLGTNDLMQFFFAADRMTPEVSERYEIVSPGFLRFLAFVADECERYGIRMSACGEATASPLAAACFVALGGTMLSMQASAIGPVKERLRGLDLAGFRQDLRKVMDAPNAAFRDQVLAIALTHGLALPDG